MEFLFEMIFEIVFEGVMEVSRSVRVPKPVRIVLVTLIILFYAAIIGLIAFVGFAMFEEGRPLAASVMFLIGVLILVLSIFAFRKTYLKRKK